MSRRTWFGGTALAAACAVALVAGLSATPIGTRPAPPNDPRHAALGKVEPGPAFLTTLRRISTATTAATKGVHRVHRAPRGDRAGGSPVQDWEDDPAVWESCRERMFPGHGVPEEVERRVPDGYRLLLDPATQRPLVRVGVGECEAVTVPGSAPQPLTWALMDVAIEPPDGRGCAARTPVIAEVKPDAIQLCNWYELFWAFDHRAMVDWVRRGSPDFPVRYVPDLRFEQAAIDPGRLGAPFRFEAGPPTPSPFVLEAIVRERPVEHPLTAVFWQDGSYGTLSVTLVTEDFAFGEAETTLRAAPGSDMAQIFGSEEPEAAPGLSTIGSIQWRRAEFRKEIR